MKMSFAGATIMLLAVAIWAVAVCFITLGSYRHHVINYGSQPLYYELKQGASLRLMAKQLAKNHIIEEPNHFVRLAYLLGVSRSLKAGEYAILPNTTVAEFINKVHRGEVITYSITFSEGMTFSQMKERLSKAGPLAYTSKDLSNSVLLETIGSQYQEPEGLFFPETYGFVKGMTDLEILKQANQTMETYLNELWQACDKTLPYKNAYEALVAASLIEKETALDEERPLISAVIVNRMQQDMPLQFDPAVIYGLGSAYTGKLTKQDLHMDNPYNTYIHKGLPPTPIALPGRASLQAALAPSDDNYLYFVATGEGGHKFSATLQQHQVAVKAYRKHLQKEATVNGE